MTIARVPDSECSSSDMLESELARTQSFAIAGMLATMSRFADQELWGHLRNILSRRGGLLRTWARDHGDVAFLEALAALRDRLVVALDAGWTPPPRAPEPGDEERAINHWVFDDNGNLVKAEHVPSWKRRCSSNPENDAPEIRATCWLPDWRTANFSPTAE